MFMDDNIYFVQSA